MNEIRGLQIKGLTLSTEENFNSIPGCKQWNDARERIQLQSGVVFWGDKSPQGNNLTQNNITAQPSYQNGLWVTSNSTSKFMRSFSSNYSFLHNGQKFGVYAILKPAWSVSTPVGAIGVLQTGTVSTTGLQGVFGSNVSMGRAGFIHRGGASSPDRVISGLLNQSSPNYSPSGPIYSYSFVNLGQTLGVRVGYGNTISPLLPFFATMGEYPSGINKTFLVGGGATGLTFRLGLLLIYDWTGFTGTQAAGFDARVKALLAVTQLEFQNLDI